jgi:hypothetical protein
MNFHLPTRLAHAFAFLAIAVSPGCWQEVNYVPSEPAQATVISSTSAAEEPAIEEVPSEATSPVEVTSSELFAPEPTQVEAEPTQVEPEPQQNGSPQTELSELPLETQTPTEPASSSSAQLPATNDAALAIEADRSNPSPDTETLDTDTVQAPDVEILRPSRSSLAVWRMSSRWSLAAAIYAKGKPAESYRDLLDQATYAASLIDMKLPQFPTAASEQLQKFVASYLLHEGSEQFANELRGEYPIEYSSLAEFAMKSHALLLIYTPKNQQLDSVVESIRTSATNSGLPAEYWEKLVGMLERREPFADVKAEVLTVHTSIGDYLSGE